MSQQILCKNKLSFKGKNLFCVDLTRNDPTVAVLYKTESLGSWTSAYLSQVYSMFDFPQDPYRLVWTPDTTVHVLIHLHKASIIITRLTGV